MHAEQKELVLSVEGHHTRVADAVELDAMRPGERLRRSLEELRVDLFAQGHQGRDRAVEHLGHDVRQRIGNRDVSMHAGDTPCEALGECNLEGLEAGIPERLAEPRDRRIGPVTPTASASSQMAMPVTRFGAPRMKLATRCSLGRSESRTAVMRASSASPLSVGVVVSNGSDPTASGWVAFDGQSERTARVRRSFCTHPCESGFPRTF